jgi:hypothetical protein
MKKDIVVLIAHYNDIKGLVKSVDSIDVEQNLDILIIDDGSAVPPQLSDFKNQEKIIKIIYSEKNQGIEHALNLGLKCIFNEYDYKYIARLDSGDVSHTERFKIQKEYLDKNKLVHMVGSNVAFVNENGKYLYTYKVPSSHREIKRKMYSKNCFIHPSVMYRVEGIKNIGYYPTNYKHAEDYAYFFKIQNTYQTANINKVLTYSYLDKNGISSKYRKQQLKSRLSVITDNSKFSSDFVLGFLKTATLFAIPDKLNRNLKTVFLR